MSLLTISRLGRRFGLSRGTLLYYHRVGLLPASGRTAVGYRYYTGKDVRRLESICRYRQAGLTLKDIRVLLQDKGRPRQKVLEQRFHALSDRILELRTQQHLLLHLMKGLAAGTVPPHVDRDLWVEMLRAAGMDDQAMRRWHTEFERRAPEAHQAFLISLGIPVAEAERIRRWSAGDPGDEGGIPSEVEAKRQAVVPPREAGVDRDCGAS